MDEDVRVLCLELESRFMGKRDGMGDDDMCEERMGEVCDIGKWISYFAWDFLGHVTWSERIGFMVRGEDVGGMIGTAERVMRYFSVVSMLATFLRDLLSSTPASSTSLCMRTDGRSSSRTLPKNRMARLRP